MGTVYESTAHNRPAGMTCYTAPAGTLNPDYTAPNVVSGPCFLSDPEDIVVNMSGTLIPLHETRISATYAAGAPPTTLVTGVLSGFISEAEARAVVLPDSLPLVGGDTLYEHLAAGRAAGSSCSSEDDRDMRGSERGFWFYFDYTAVRATWSGP
jgi:hypothetical protein